MTRCRICDKEYVPYQSILGDHEGLCQECEGSVLETIAEWELEKDVPESQCAAHTEAVGDGQVGEGRKTEETVHEEHNVSSKENEGQEGTS